MTTFPGSERVRDLDRTEKSVNAPELLVMSRSKRGLVSLSAGSKFKIIGPDFDAMATEAFGTSRTNPVVAKSIAIFALRVRNIASGIFSLRFFFLLFLFVNTDTGF